MIWLVSGALAGGFEVPYQDARSAAMGGAGTTVPGSSPALVPMGPSLAIGVAAARPRITATALSQAHDAPWESTTGGGSFIPHLHASVGLDSVAFGLDAGVPFGGGVTWEDDWQGRFDIQQSRTQVLRVAPYLTGRFGRVAVSGGVHVDHATLEVRKATDHVSEEGTAHLLLRDRGIGADVAVAFAAGPVLLGARWQGRTRYDLAGHADFDVPDAFAGTLPDQTVSAAWSTPDRVALGLGAQGFHADVVWTRWSVLDELVFVLPESDDVVQPYDWKNSWALRLGVEAERQGFDLRAGGAIDGLGGPPGPVETLSPSSPDGVRIQLTAGAGRQLHDNVRVDAFAEHLRILARDSESPSAIEASYAGQAWVGGLTLSVRGNGGRDTGTEQERAATEMTALRP